MYYDEKLSVNDTNLFKLSSKAAELNESDISMYAWITDHGGAFGLAFLGAACHVGSGSRSKVSITRGPSRYNAIIETAEVYDVNVL